MMETVIVMPILLFIIFALIQLAHIWLAKQMVSYAAFCATRAIMVAKASSGDPAYRQPSEEQREAARNAAYMALSWMCIGSTNNVADAVSVPGWGDVNGTGSVTNRVFAEIVRVGDVGEYLDGAGTNNPVAAVKVTFRFPTVITGMAVNKVFAAAAAGKSQELDGTPDFYGDLAKSAQDTDEIDGWPYVTLTETCVLPMPYSTVDFPVGAYNGNSLR